MNKILCKCMEWLNIAPPKISPPQGYLGATNDTFSGNTLWSPGGYVSYEDEIAQNRYMVSGPFSHATQYAYTFPFHGRQNGDEKAIESYEWGWIPTEQQLASAVALQNIGTVLNHQNETSLQQNDPLQNQLLQAIYRSANSFWQDVRISNGTGWGYGE